jgi:PmbA protein
VFATGEQGERQRDGWYDASTNLARLATPESIGREAARRALRGVGWRRAPSGPAPVVFPPDLACDLAGTIASAVSASSVYRGGTYLADSLGERIASDVVTLTDDSTLPGRLGSRAFDGEGVRGRRTPVVVEGVLQSWLADTYSARRTSTSTTGNAARGPGGPPSVGSTNLVLAGGQRTQKELIGDVRSGLFVTSLFGFGVNLATGAWSRGGSGIWIENGEFAYPVQELTIAGDLPTLLGGVREAGSDLTWHGGCAAPTLLVEGLTVAGG